MRAQSSRGPELITEEVTLVWSPRSHFPALRPLAEQGRRDLSSGLSSHTSPSSCPSHSLRGCLQRTWSWLLGSAPGWEAWKLVAVRSQGPAPVLVGAVLPWDAPTAFHGASGSGHGALVSLSGNNTQDGWASTHLGVSRKDRSPVRSHPLVLRTHEDVRGRGRERGRRRSLGMLQSSLLRPVLRPSGASTHERSVVSPLEAHEIIKQRKHNNKYCSFLNLCSSSIACCKQCLNFVFFLIIRNHGQTGAESECPCPPVGSRTEPLEAWPMILQGPAPGEPGLRWGCINGRAAQSPSGDQVSPLGVTVGKPKGKVPKSAPRLLRFGFKENNQTGAKSIGAFETHTSTGEEDARMRGYKAQLAVSRVEPNGSAVCVKSHLPHRF